MNKLYIGIDVGKSGGIVVMDKTGILQKLVMPLLSDRDLDVDCIYRLLQEWIAPGQEVMVVIEKLHAMPHFGAKGNFGFGGQYYAIKTILRIMGIPYTEVIARSWQKELFQGITPVEGKEGKHDTKKTARIAVERLFPNVDLRESPRCKNFHEGLVDALLIAEYCKRHFK